MKSLTTADFWQAYGRLSPDAKALARKVYRLWQEDMFYPSLHFKKVGKQLWSVRISRDYRALALKRGEDYVWIWIGTHREYDEFLK
ncbi:hypothetical protein [Acaryochloris sp. CCMEE 5410]|uniref:ParE family toxin-like protein n=1 Tax=Acaryochloris sp. CCMEE 5410 TaxID=310037 RepID=UPI0002484486|nr:hypothetical protein [Acaryochloris sp. CCMEE 5410]KAI9134022.1 hypothetical protein ON05_012495 [Acaryochloris sp. CCMEE 5410]